MPTHAIPGQKIRPPPSRFQVAASFRLRTLSKGIISGDKTTALDVALVKEHHHPAMKSPALALVLLLALPALALRATDDSPAFIVKNDLVPSPAVPGASAPRLVNAPDGTVYLSWLEPAPARRTALRFARFDAATRTWSPARTIGESHAPSVPANLTPSLAISSANALAALWHPATALATLTTSIDGGLNWSAPLVLNRPSRPADHATLQALPGGQFLAAWIEPEGKSGTLLARTTAQDAAPVVVDPAVSAGCAPVLAVFPDGSAVVAYRGLTPDGIRDIRTARFHDGRWDAPATLSPDNWKPSLPTRNSPALAVRGPHLAAAWFTAAEGARVNVSTSDDAGAQWLIPSRVDDIAPLGSPSLALFDDGSLLVAWVERTATERVVLLRRISARGSLSVPVQIGRTVDGATPTLVRVKDGDATPAQVLVTTLNPPPATPESAARLPSPSFITLRLVTLPSAAELAEADPCNCDPRPEDVRGYAIKGRVVSIDAARGTLQLEHAAILGVLPAGTTTLQVGPEVLRDVQPGRTILARVERTGADWSLFNVRTLETVPAVADPR